MNDPDNPRKSLKPRFSTSQTMRGVMRPACPPLDEPDEAHVALEDNAAKEQEHADKKENTRNA